MRPDQILDGLLGLDILPDAFAAAVRSILEHAREQETAAQVAQNRKEQNFDEDVSDDRVLALFDQRSVTRRVKRKWYLPETTVGDKTGASRLTKKRGLCFHHTAVRGGFGPRHNDVRTLMAQALDRTVFTIQPPSLAHEQWARAVALAKRYRGSGASDTGVPYHVVFGPNDVTYLNLPFDWVTWHGSGSNNDFLGVAWDANSREQTPDPAVLRPKVEQVVQIAREEGHEIVEFTCHSAWTRKPDDPGKAFIEEVLVPCADDLGIAIRWDFVAGGGTPMRKTVAGG